MRSGFKSRLTYANVVATLALFMTLSGSAFAVTSLPNDSVGNQQLKDGAVSSAKLRNGAVTATKVAKHTLTGAEIKSSTLGTVPKATVASAPAPLASGKTEVGDWSVAGVATAADQLTARNAQSFAFPLGAPVSLDFASTSGIPKRCPGTADDPRAARGNLCIYLDPGAASNAATFPLRADRRGFSVGAVAAAAGQTSAAGTWALTAP